MTLANTKETRKYRKLTNTREANEYSTLSSTKQKPSKRAQEARKLRRMVARDSESLAAKQAIALLETWGEPVEAEPAEETKPNAEFREWTDRTGKFKVVALFVELDGDEVVLRRQEGGQQIRVPVDRLSTDDQIGRAHV